MYKKSVYVLVLTVAGMLALGIVILFSTSAFAQDSHGDPVYFVKRQAMWLVVGVFVCIGASLLDYHFWQKTWWLWFGVAVILLVLCFVPPIGMKINGSHRWVNLVVMSFQPSELAKYAVVFFLAYWFSKYEKRSGEFWKGFALPAMIVTVPLILIALEEDLGTTALIGCTMFIVMFVAGTSLFYISPVAFLGVGGILYAAINMQERLGRLMAFMDLEKFKQGAGLQQYQAKIAFGSGGLTGLGLGDGRQKMLYLPFSHTDFILPMIGEELGLRATLLIVTGYLVIILCGALISMLARDRFGTLLGFGIVILLSIQAGMNIGVTTGMMPNKGLPLPFISYGGSNLVICLLGVGILINIYLQGVGESRTKTTTRLRARMTPRI